MFEAACYGGEVTSSLSVFKDTKRREGGERSGPEERRQREEQRAKERRRSGPQPRRPRPCHARQKGKKSDGSQRNRTPTPRK